MDVDDRGRNADAAGERPEEAQPNLPPAIAAYEFASLVEMIGADMPEVVVDILDTYQEESNNILETIRSAAQRSDEAAMLRPVHSLKSSSASIGALRLSGLCGVLEDYLRGGHGDVNVPVQVDRISAEHGRVTVAIADIRRDFLAQ